MADTFGLENSNDGFTKDAEPQENILYWHIAPRTYVSPGREHDENTRAENNPPLLETLERLVIKLIYEYNWTFDDFKLWIYNIFHNCSNEGGFKLKVKNLDQLLKHDGSRIYKPMSANPHSNQTYSELEKSGKDYNSPENVEKKIYLTEPTASNNDSNYVEEIRREFSKDGKYILEGSIQMLENQRYGSKSVERYCKSIDVTFNHNFGKLLTPKREACNAEPSDLPTTTDNSLSDHRGDGVSASTEDSLSHKVEENKSHHDLENISASLVNGLNINSAIGDVSKETKSNRDNNEPYLKPVQGSWNSNSSFRTKMTSDIDKSGRKVFKFTKHYDLPSTNQNQVTKTPSQSNDNTCPNNKMIEFNNSLGQKLHEEVSGLIKQRHRYKTPSLVKTGTKNGNEIPIHQRLITSSKIYQRRGIQKPVEVPNLSLGHSNRISTFDVQRTGYDSLKQIPVSFLRFLQRHYPYEANMVKTLKKEQPQIQTNDPNKYKIISNQYEENETLVKDSNTKMSTSSQILPISPSYSNIELLWHSHKVRKSRIKMFNKIRHLHLKGGRSFRVKHYLPNDHTSKPLLTGRSTQHFPLTHYKEYLPNTADYRSRFQRREGFRNNRRNLRFNRLPLPLGSNITYNHPTQYLLEADKSVLDEISPLAKTDWDNDSSKAHSCTIL